MNRKIIALLIMVAVLVTAAAVWARGLDSADIGLEPFIDPIANLVGNQKAAEEEIAKKRDDLQRELEAFEAETWTRVENLIELKANTLKDKVFEDTALHAEKLEQELKELQGEMDNKLVRHILNTQMKTLLAGDAPDVRKVLGESLVAAQTELETEVKTKTVELQTQVAEYQTQRQQAAEIELEEYTSAAVAEAENRVAKERARVEAELAKLAS